MRFVRPGGALSLGLTVGLAFGATACGGGDGDGGRDGAPDARIDGGAGVDAAARDGGGACEPPTFTIIDPASRPELALTGDVGSTTGVFDPSIVYPGGAPAGAMSYSTVPAAAAIRSRIAVSADAGATWLTVADATTPTAATLPSTDVAGCPGGTCSGTLVDETSSLIIDLDDPDADRRWKLFTYRYLVTDADVIRYDYGTISLYTAPAPEGPWSAPENLIGWPSTSSHSTAGVSLNAGTIPALADCIALAEPGALWVPGNSIELALGCVYFQGGATRIRIEQLRSVDHAATWTHVGTLLDGDDAACLGSDDPRLNAPALFFSGGEPYLVVSPDTNDQGYQGCVIVPIGDLGSASVDRAPGTGAPTVARAFAAPGGRFSGACTYAEGATAAGLVVPIAFIDAPPRVFRIFTTGLALP